MYIKDYMTTELITISRNTSIAKASDLMNAHDINRLPVIEDGQLVGLVTREIVVKNSPSDATSLDRHELNYLLEKATVEDIMQKNVITKTPETLLDEAAATMSNENIGVLVVVDEQDRVAGIITDKDIFKAFIDISGYYSRGTSLVIELEEDRQGVIEEVGDSLVETDHNLTHMMVYHLDGAIRVVLHVESEVVTELTASLTSKGYDVQTVVNR
ncbi:CBS domain-containing protein [Aerococcaceae bacterium DSM 111022]|nr:CBS domain-containing protein [Aerococcaceae bacterium DSM 111022]